MLYNINMLRSFLPVGQGAFYREVFDFGGRKITLIYDCGSSPDKSVVEQQIKNEFCIGERIDAVFISHLDEDHINGLPFLLEYCHVRNLFFPLVTTKDKIYLKLQTLLMSSKNKFLHNFIQNPKQTIRDLNPETKLFWVSINGEEQTNEDDIPIVFSGKNVIDSLNLKNEDWELIPFNFRQETRIKALRGEISKNFQCDESDVDKKIDELIRDYPKNKDKIKEAYRNVSGSFNTNSLTLFSGIKNHDYTQRYAKHHCCRYFRCGIENGCLYMGDYDASGLSKWEDLKKAYSDYWDYIGCIQVPHHGSQYNYNYEMSKLSELYVISAGYNNKYQHPHSKVIKDLLLNHCNVHIVTEMVGSQLDLRVD